MTLAGLLFFASLVLIWAGYIAALSYYRVNPR
jgi:uncharacterized membrane protein